MPLLHEWQRAQDELPVMRNMIQLQHVKAAILDWPSAYVTREGERVTARRPAEIGSYLSRRFRGATRLDVNDYRALGARVVTATYAQSARPTGKWINVVVLPE